MRTIAAVAALALLAVGSAGATTPDKTMDQQRLAWERNPSTIHLDRFFPAAAKSARIKDATVQVACTPDQFGALDCSVMSENPVGLGFGEAAVKTLEKAKVTAGPGASPEGRTFRYAVHFGKGVDRGDTTRVADARR